MTSTIADMANGPKKPKVDRRVLRTKKALFGAYERLLSDPDTGRITISSLTREAGVDRKTFYLHYSSLEGMHDDMIVQLVSRIMDALLSPSGRVERLDYLGFLTDVNSFFKNRTIRVCEEFNRLIEENPHVIKHLFSTSTMANLVGRFKELVVVDAMKTADISRERIEVCATFVAGSIVSCYHLWLTSDMKMTLPELSQMCSDLISAGMVSYLDQRIGLVKGGMACAE